MSLVEEIQSRSIDRTVRVSDLLRMVKLAAAKLKLTGTLEWVENELNGYSGGLFDIPPYRIAAGTLMHHSRFHGTQLAHGNPTTIAALSISEFRDKIGSLESLLDASGDHFSTSINRNVAEALNKSGQTGTYEVFFSKNVVVAILEAVRNMVLDWAIKLEEEGILGERVSFSMEERKKAAEAGASINITNYGHLHHGDVNGHQNRTTVNGTDASSNSLSADVFEQVQSAIANHVDQTSDSEILLELLKQMKDQKGTSGFRDLYGKFLVAAANHMTVLSPFLPALSAHLPG